MDILEDKATQDPSATQMATLTLSSIKFFAYGSAECDQFYINEDEYQAKRPIDLTNYFSALDRKAFMVTCGGLHTVVLTTNGEVYTFGCNDDGALGRQGDESKPGKVELEAPVNMIAAGDSHSVACNSAKSLVYHWGCYRNVHKGNISKSQVPHRIGEEEFKRKNITKILSGANHTLVLADGKIFAWGDADAGILGRLPTQRRKFDQGLKIEGMGIKSPVDDIYTGAYHSFLKKTYRDKNTNQEITTIFAWGLNNCGQLGIGSTTNSHVPIEIMEFRGINIKSIVGGEHHTLALTEEGQVYAFGKNDDGQLGLGEDFVEVREPQNQNGENAVTGDMEEEKVEMPKNVVIKPRKINISNVKVIYAGANHNYCVTKTEQVYTWGMGDNYILGTRKDDTEYEPKEVPQEFFKCKKIHQFGLGAQHIVYIGLDDENEVPVLDKSVTLKEEKQETPKQKTPRASTKPPKIVITKPDEEVKQDEIKTEKVETKEVEKVDKAASRSTRTSTRSKSEKKSPPPKKKDTKQSKTSAKKGVKTRASQDEDDLPSKRSKTKSVKSATAKKGK